MCRFEFKPVEIANVHIPLNVSSSHGESLPYEMENGKEILNSYYSPSGRHLSCISNMMSLLCAISGVVWCAQRSAKWPMTTTLPRKFEISKSIVYVFVAAKTWRSTNWRLAWSIYLKLRIKCKKGQRHHTIIRWRTWSIRLDACRTLCRLKVLYIFATHADMTVCSSCIL